VHGTAVDRRYSGRRRLAVVVGGSLREGLKRIAGDVVRLCVRGIEEGLSEDDKFWCQDELAHGDQLTGK